jgi:hypothetical protein
VRAASLWLVRWRNETIPTVPQQPDSRTCIITRPQRRVAPRPDQEWPAAYEVLDAILNRCIENDHGIESTVAEEGFDRAVVERVARLTASTNTNGRHRSASG